MVRKGSTVRVRQRASSDLPATAGFSRSGASRNSLTASPRGSILGRRGSTADPAQVVLRTAARAGASKWSVRVRPTCPMRTSQPLSSTACTTPGSESANLPPSSGTGAQTALQPDPGSSAVGRRSEVGGPSRSRLAETRIEAKVRNSWETCGRVGHPPSKAPNSPGPGRDEARTMDGWARPLGGWRA
jgi:hypothetical protein